MAEERGGSMASKQAQAQAAQASAGLHTPPHSGARKRGSFAAGSACREQEEEAVVNDGVDEAVPGVGRVAV